MYDLQIYSNFYFPIIEKTKKCSILIAMKIINSHKTGLEQFCDNTELFKKILALFPLDYQIFSYDSIDQVITQVKSKVILSFGIMPLETYSKKSLMQSHGLITEGFYNKTSFQFIPLFHPDTLTLNENLKKTFWKDLQRVFSLLGC